MSHISPTVYTFWSVLCVMLLTFLVSHLWKFDRFQCLKFGRRNNTGAFKRVMTFSYITSVPLITIYSIGMMVIKYREGYVDIPLHGVVPTPYQLWSPQNRSLLVPFYMMFSVAWGLEIVSHLEELCFWLFLISVGPGHTSWFRSLQFKIWLVGSVASMVGIPLATWFTRHDVLKCEAYTILIGSSCSLLVTIWSLRVIWVFPGFVGRVKSSGGEPEVVVRLQTFHDLNITRVIFRFFFVTSFVILGADGTAPHSHVNESVLWTDFLASVGGIGLIVSSAFTLLIFFPRSIEREAGYVPRRRSASGRAEEISLHPIQPQIASPTTGPRPFFDPARRPSVKITTSIVSEEDNERFQNKSDKRVEVWEVITAPNAPTNSSPNNHPNSRPFATSVRPQRPRLHPMLMNYSSPIDMEEEDETEGFQLVSRV